MAKSLEIRNKRYIEFNETKDEELSVCWSGTAPVNAVDCSRRSTKCADGGHIMCVLMQIWIDKSISSRDKVTEALFGEFVNGILKPGSDSSGGCLFCEFLLYKGTSLCVQLEGKLNLRQYQFV
jgi:hypothetical protein